jgi:hypothetical protein
MENVSQLQEKIENKILDLSFSGQSGTLYLAGSKLILQVKKENCKVIMYCKSNGWRQLPDWMNKWHDSVNNVKYLDSTGHLEAIYNRNTGVLINTGPHRGTYNLYSPIHFPDNALHMVHDVWLD